VSIPKPKTSKLDKFKSRPSSGAKVETRLPPLPHHNLKEAGDFVRLHEDEENYWSSELAFVNVPIKGQKRDLLHLIDLDLTHLLPKGRIQWFRLVLASKPYDVFFLCHVPTRNLDNGWNQTNLKACERAKKQWVQVSSLKEEGKEAYKIDTAEEADAFPNPTWPSQSLEDLILETFSDRMIEDQNHPALLRLLGKKQSLT